MAANNDNAMTRFLFAILRQKSLRDIDWDKVAQDPVLAQPISNGHAARMRFSRFRAQMEGRTSQPRNRTKSDKNRVVKPKKESKQSKTKRDDKEDTDEDETKNGEDKDELVKPDPSAAARCGNAWSPKIKPEQIQPAASDGHPTPASMPIHMFPDTQNVHFQTRLLTPCSDTDVMMTSSHGSYPADASPPGDMLQPEPTFADFSPTGHCSHDRGSWNHSPVYPSFGTMGYELDNFASGFCEEPSHQAPANGSCVPAAIMKPDSVRQVTVKHEHWEAQYHSP